MGIIVDTAGNYSYTIPGCDCGSTGGCVKCMPATNARYNYRDCIPLEEEFLDNNLKEFYRKRGLL